MKDSNDWTFNDFKQCSTVLDNLCEVKDAEYGRSYAKRGLIRGCMANIDRKYDRLDEQMGKWEPGKGKAIDLLESLGDLRNYCQLTIMLLKEKFPNEYDAWKGMQLEYVKGKS